MAKHPFYQSYSWWILLLIPMYLLKIIKFSLLPSVLFTIIGAIVFFIIKYIYNKKSFNLIIATIVSLYHFIPLFLIPLTATQNDIFYNLIIVIIYLLSLSLQNINFYDVYYNLLITDNNTGIYNYFKDAGVLP